MVPHPPPQTWPVIPLSPASRKTSAWQPPGVNTSIEAANRRANVEDFMVLVTFMVHLCRGLRFTTCFRAPVPVSSFDEHRIQNHCAEIKIRAERRAGDAVREMERDRGKGGDRKSKSHRATLKQDVGVTPKQSSRRQKIAAVAALV
jgi:hypothetical protein